MANGAVALRFEPAPKPPSAPPCAKPATAKPPAPPVASEIETKIGETVAKCAIAISQGIADFAAGGAMAPMTRILGGEYLAQLAQLHLDTFGEIDFAAVAHREGKRSMLQRHGTTLRQLNLDPAALERALTELIGMATAISDRVCRDEMAFTRAMAN